ncbi:unnamed protein product [Peronospora destructor]|uniref:Methylenetetrahydrofolate reductase (NAD(P)H) n=1 Tax=Peronospora destructor TaxID=86335 RepID=A0AAV0U5V9_9STRA|nr:unnamed protein product [Peronospora destructor]
MGKIIESIHSVYSGACGRYVCTSNGFSFEFFPAPRRNAGVFNLRRAWKEWVNAAADVRDAHAGVPLLKTRAVVTHRSNASSRMRVPSGVTTFSNSPGDPPIGPSCWAPVEGGMSNAMNVANFIREELGDYFCIAPCPGICRSTPGRGTTRTCRRSNEARGLDLQRLKAKQNAGADFIITQFFFDVNNMIQWIADCKDAATTVTQVLDDLQLLPAL